MTYEEAREILLKMAFAESTDFAEDRLFAFGYSDEHEALNIAIEALEKQMPKKPNNDVDTTWGIRKKVNVCPKCDYYLGNYAFINTKDILEKHKVTYCETCGQAIDWSEVE